MNRNPAGDSAKAPRTVRHLIEVSTARNPQAIAVAAPGCSGLTYSELERLIARTVAELNSMGIARNDRVAIVLPNGPEMATAFLAVASAATAAPLNPAYQTSEFEFYLTDLRAKAVLLSRNFAPAAVAAAETRGIPIIELEPRREPGAGSFALSLPDAAISLNEHRSAGFAAADDVALVLHTSGTTSKPKIVPLTHANLCASARNIQRTLFLEPGDRCLNVMPLFHIHGLMAAVLGSLYAGASVACTPGHDSGKFFDWLDAFQPTWYTAVPTIHQSVLERALERPDAARATSLRFIRSSSSALPPQTMRSLEEAFGVPVIEAYGMTEAAHQMCSNPLPPGKRRPGFVGLAAGPEVAIMDDCGNLLPAGQTGEIVIRGENVTGGYESNDDANAAAFTRGWFRTGDQGVIDANGYVSLTGRLKEIINRGGEKISPREVDEALLDHPAVAQVVTFAVPHASLGEDVASCVVRRNGASCTEQELREFAFTRLADFKVPTRVVFVESIPKGPSGKLQRIGLHKHLAEFLQTEYEAPSGPIETLVAEVWAEILPVDRVGRNDNFFSLGGDSLMAKRIMARIQAAFELELPFDAAFRAPTITNLAALIESHLGDEMDSGAVAGEMETGSL